MNVRTAKKPDARVEVGYLSTLGIQGYGHDNLYPQNLARIVTASQTARGCLSRYAEFVEGDGWADEALSVAKLNRKGATGDDLLAAVANDVAKYGGYALHVNYNVFAEVVEVQHVPFEMCRLEEEDAQGYVAHVVVHPDWTGKKTREGKPLKVSKETVSRFNVFNPQAEVVQAQIEAVGGIENYDGQILWQSLDGSFVYPTPRYDSAITEMSTDEGLSNVKNRNVRNNFLMSCMLVAKKGAPRYAEDGTEEERAMIEPETLRKFQGDTNGNKILYIELENDEDEPKVVEFPAKNYDKDFTVTDESTVERIYSSFKQELFHAIRRGKLGFSGQVMADAYADYAGQVTREQRFIGRGFAAVMSRWHEVGVKYGFEVKPRRYILSGNGKASVNG